MVREQGIDEELLRIAGDTSLTAQERWRNLTGQRQV